MKSRDQEILEGQCWNNTTLICIADGEQHNLEYRYSVYLREIPINLCRVGLTEEELAEVLKIPEAIEARNEYMKKWNSILDKVRSKK